MKRYWLTGKQATKSTLPSTLTGGWNTTQLMLTAAANLAVESPERSLTLAGMVEEVDRLMLQHGIRFVGTTNFPERYASPGERVVHGRFGDMRKSGFFTTHPPLLVAGLAPLHIHFEQHDHALESLEELALKVLRRHGQLTERDLCKLLNTHRISGVMANLAEKLPLNTLQIEDAGPSGNLYILSPA